jgi:hypothetical protein
MEWLPQLSFFIRVSMLPKADVIATFSADSDLSEDSKGLNDFILAEPKVGTKS